MPVNKMIADEMTVYKMTVVKIIVQNDWTTTTLQQNNNNNNRNNYNYNHIWCCCLHVLKQQ